MRASHPLAARNYTDTSSPRGTGRVCPWALALERPGARVPADILTDHETFSIHTCIQLHICRRKRHILPPGAWAPAARLTAWRGGRGLGSGLSPDPPLTHPCDRGHPASPGGQAGEQGGRRRGSRGHLAAPARRACGAAKACGGAGGHTSHLGCRARLGRRALECSWSMTWMKQQTAGGDGIVDYRRRGGGGRRRRRGCCWRGCAVARMRRSAAKASLE